MRTPVMPPVASLANGFGVRISLGQRVAAPVVSAALAASRPEPEMRIREEFRADWRIEANFAVRREFEEFHGMLDLQTPPCL